jgi:hypothetical protein
MRNPDMSSGRSPSPRHRTERRLPTRAQLSDGSFVALDREPGKLIVVKRGPELFATAGAERDPSAELLSPAQRDEDVPRSRKDGRHV